MAVLSSPIKSTSSLARKQKTEGKVKGADSVLKASSKKLQLPENDDTPVTVTKVNKIVETKVKRLQPKITKKVRSAIKPFDPRKMLSDIFKGGLGQLEKFAKSLAGLKKPLGEIFKFINKAKNIFLSLLKKLTKIKLAPKTEPGKKEKKKKGGLIGNILKGAATLGLIALTTWGISKLLDRGKEDKEVKPGESTVKSVEPLEGTELLNKKEVKKFNKALKVFQQALWDFKEQVKKAADSKPKTEEETTEDKPTTDNEKVQSLAGTTQTALIPGDIAPSELNVLVPKVEDAGGENNKSTTDTSQETATTASGKSTVIPHNADHSTSGGTTSGGNEGSGDGSTATSKTKPLGKENVEGVQVGNTNISYNKTEHEDGSITENYSSFTNDIIETGSMDNVKIEVDGKMLKKGDPGWEKAVREMHGSEGKWWQKSKVNKTSGDDKSLVQPNNKESDLRRENSLGVSKTVEGESSQTTETVINVPPGTSTEQALPKSGNQVARTPEDSSASVRVPFYTAVDGSNFALLHSKSQYNIVDAL